MKKLKAFWAKAKRSATIAVGAVVGALSAAFSALMLFAESLDLATFKAEVAEALSASPELAGYVLTGVTVLTIIARLRSLLKG